MIPLVLSLALAGGVYLTFDGLARPRPWSAPRLRLRAVDEFLVRAGLHDVTPRDFCAFSVAAGALAALVAQLFLGWGVVSLLSGALGLLAPYAYYIRRHDRRRAAVQDALVEAIEQLRDAIRTGLSVPDALAGLARGGPQALRPEFGLLARDTRLIGFEPALLAMQARLADPVFDVVACALRVNDRLGGQQVSHVLDRLAEATRAQLRIQQEVRAHQGRTVLSARIVAAAPLVALIGLRATNPRYLSIFDSFWGQLVLIACAVSIGLGYAAMLYLTRLPEPAAGARPMIGALLTASIQWAALDTKVIALPLLFGRGLFLLLTALPFGRPKPDLGERLRRLDVDERIRLADAGRHTPQPLFASRLLENMLRPVVEDAGRGLRAILLRVGLTGGRELEARLGVLRPGVQVVQFLGEKVAGGLIVAATFPVMNLVHLHPFGVWPVWVWLVGFGVGFLFPDWDLQRREASRRGLVLMELPTILDMLTLAASAGMALEQALAEVAEHSEGVVARELRLLVRELALGQRHSLPEALEAMQARLGTPEVEHVLGRLRAAYEQGLPLAQALAAHAQALRERQRLHIVEEGGKATVRMLLPVALLILPALFVVVLVPAAAELTRLGG